ELACLTNLTRIGLCYTGVTAAGLKGLTPLKNLQTLDLAREHVTDGILRVLRQMGLLHALSKAAAKGNALPRSAEEVLRLALDYSQVTNEGLHELAPLINLHTLWLDNTRIGDAGIEALFPLRKLVELDLSFTMVTDAGIEALSPLRNLGDLDLSSTMV